MDTLTSAGLLAAQFAVWHQQLRTGTDRGEILGSVLHVAVTGVPGCDWAGLTSWPVNQSPRNMAATSELVGQIDDLQDDSGEGPCLTAILGNEPALLADVSRPGGRWPVFAAEVHARSPVRGVLSIPVGDQTDRAALNLYTAVPGRFESDHAEPDAVEQAKLFAAHTRALLLHAHTSHQNTHLQIALTSSRQIGAAIGVLMNTYRISNDNAFALLRRVSQQRNIKLRDLADTVIATGQLPTSPDGSASRASRPA